MTSADKPVLRIALLGCGVVGSQVARLLESQAADLEMRIGARLELAGIAAGVAGALILTRTLPSLSHLLYGVGSSDPLTFAAVSLVLIAVAALASYIPARRAAKVDPVVALRYE